MCFLSLIPRYNKFTKALIRVPSRSPIHAKSESLIDEDNIFAISPPIVNHTYPYLVRPMPQASHGKSICKRQQKRMGV